MKKRILLLILVVIFLLPAPLQAKSLFIKMSLGIASGGDIDDILITRPEFAGYISIGQDKKSKLGQGVYMELIYQVSPHLSFSVGNGYLYKLLTGNTAEFAPPAFKGKYFLTPEFSAEAIPIYISAVFTFPIKTSFQINIMGGLGYYFGTFESKSKWRTPDYPGYTTWEYRSWNFKGSDRAIGFHLGAGFDLGLYENLFMTLDARYRTVNFNSIKSQAELGVDTTLFYLEFYESKHTQVDFDYRVNQVSLSGFSLQGGFKFRF